VTQERLALAMEARQRLENLRAGAQFLTLLAAVEEKGWLGFLAEPRTDEELAEFAGLRLDRVQDVLAALEANGVVEREGGKARLSGPFDAVTADDAWIPLGDTLAQISLESRLIAAAVSSPGPLALSEDDALVVANAVGGRTTEVALTLYDQLIAQVPELAELPRRGRWLDVGCGVACASLTLATRMPEMRTVAVELVPAVAAEAVRRAQALGLADRVDVRRMDARDLTEQDGFVGAFWAQPFFPEATRPATLAVILRALRPGGKLLVQELEPQPSAETLPAHSLRRLIGHGLGAWFAPTAEQLAEEAVTAGFELDRIASTDFGRMVIARKPA
jgi:SAM-dependent methyltransferase